MVFAVQVDQLQELEHAVISGGGEIVPGELVDKFIAWLESEPAAVDTDRAQLLAALGVSP